MDLLETKYLYLYLLLFSIAYPLAQSFEWRLRYHRQWKHLLPAIGIMATVFIPWDIWFTSQGVWWFNEKYTSGFKTLLLPIEEWLFFWVESFLLPVYSSMRYSTTILERTISNRSPMVFSSFSLWGYCYWLYFIRIGFILSSLLPSRPWL